MVNWRKKFNCRKKIGVKKFWRKKIGVKKFLLKKFGVKKFRRQIFLA